MNNNQEDREIQELMKEAPLSHETPSRLKYKLQAAAVGPRVRHTSPWHSRFAVAGIAAIVLLAVGVGTGIGLYGTPTLTAQAKTFQKVVNAMNNLDAFQLVVRAKDANNGDEVNIAYTDGKFNLSTREGTVMRIEGTTMEVFDPKKNEIVEMNLGGVVDPKMIAGQIQESMRKGIEEFDIKKMLEDMEKEYGKENVHVGPIQHKSGRSTYDIKLEKPNGPERIFMTVDADNDIPVRISVERLQNGSYTAVSDIELRFGNDIDPNLVITEFPANAKRTKIDLGKMIEQGMQGMDGDMKGLGETMKQLGESFKDKGEGKKLDIKIGSDVKISR